MSFLFSSILQRFHQDERPPEFGVMKIFLAFAVAVGVLHRVESRPVAEVVESPSEDPPRVLRISTDSMANLILFPYRVCWDKAVTLRLTGGGGVSSPEVSSIPCRDRVRRLIIDDDAHGVSQLPRLLHLLPNVESVVVVKSRGRQRHHDGLSPASSVSPSFQLKPGRLRLLKLRGLGKDSFWGWSVLDMLRSGGVESLVVESCDLRGEGTVSKLRQFLKHSSPSLESLELSEVEVSDGGGGQLAKVFQGLPEMMSLKRLSIRVDGADMFEEDASLWRSVSKLFPHLEELSTNLKVSLEWLKDGLERLRVVRLFVDPQRGDIDFSFVKGKDLLEELVVSVFCKEPHRGVRVGGLFRKWPKALTVVTFKVSAECDLSVKGWLSVEGSEFFLIKDPHTGDQVVVVRKGQL